MRNGQSESVYVCDLFPVFRLPTCLGNYCTANCDMIPWSAPYSPAASRSSLLRPRGSPTTKAAAEPASAPNSERLTTKPDWNADS